MKTKTLMTCVAALAAGVLTAAGLPDVVVENKAFKLVLGGDARAKSLVVKATGEELLDATESVPAFSVIQDRPFNNEVKLVFPNKRTEFRADRVRRVGDDLFVGFELVSYEAQIRLEERDGFVTFELVDFPLGPRGANGLAMTYPPVDMVKILNLPVKNRAHFGDWLNVVWDDRATVSLFAGEPYTWIDRTERPNFRVLTAEARRGLKLRGAKAVLVATASPAFMDAMDAAEVALGLPRGVKSRRDPRMKMSNYWTYDLSPANVDEHIAYAKKGGFTKMLVYHSTICRHPGDYRTIGDYEPDPAKYPKGYESIREMLAKIKAAGIMPGLHLLQTFVGFDSRYVSPVADSRLNLKRHFTLAKPFGAAAKGDLFVQENPADSPTNAPSRILAFGGELLAYEGFTTERPYRFTGVTRGAKKTNVVDHPQGQIGGILDVCEFGGGVSCYIDQNTDLQDEIAAKIAKIYDCGFEFMYNDGSEGVNVPQGIHVANAQYRVWKKVAKKPLYTEGAAKSHFGWHIQAGANAFDMFCPEEFKDMIVRWPLYEAPIMRENFTQLDFGWWYCFPPSAGSTGTQPDMWEYGTSKAAAWDCPVTVQMPIAVFVHNPRGDDLLEVMRRWEDVRAKDWLTPEQKTLLRDPKREFHLYVNEKGAYELVEWRQLAVAGRKDGPVRAFAFERAGKRVVAYWHTHGRGDLDLGSSGRLAAENLAYWTTDLPMPEVERLFADARIVKVPHVSVFASNLKTVARQRGVSLEKAAELLRDAGVRGFDCDYASPDLPAFSKTVLKPINLFGFIDFLAPDGGAAQQDAFIDAAVAYHLPRIMIVAIDVPRGEITEEAYAKIRDGLKRIAGKARKLGIVPTIEDYGGTNNICSHVEYVKRLLTDVPDLGYALDSGNVYYAGRGEDVLDLMRFAEKRTAHIHLKDQSREDNHRYVTLGTGAVPNETIVRAAAARGYEDWFTLENPVGPDLVDDVRRQVSAVRSWYCPPRAVTPAVPDAGWTRPWWRSRHAEKLAAVTNGGAKVVFIGDSITHFWETAGAEQQRRYFGSGDRKMLNLGFSGDRTEHVLWRLREGRELDGFEAKVIFLLIGTNNSSHFPIEQERPEDTVLGIREIVKTIREKQPSAKLVLTAIFPIGADAKDARRARNAAVNREIAKLADDRDVFWLDINDRLMPADGTLSRELFPDFIHPGPRGYAIWAEAAAPYATAALADRPMPPSRFSAFAGDLVFENARFRLTVGADAIVRSLTLKATGEELLDLAEPTALFSVTQPRPFNNEIKLAHPNARTTYQANRMKVEKVGGGMRLVVGFETAPYEAVVETKVTDDYIAFTLKDFLLTEKSYPLCPTTTEPLDFTAPPVDEFRLAQLPVRDRVNFGEWLGVVWDSQAAVALLSTSEHALVGSEKRAGYRRMWAAADRRVRIKGTGAALAVDRGGEALLDRIDAFERDYGLPRGVANRRNPLVNASIYFACHMTPKTVDRHIELAKRGGFRLMEISAANFLHPSGDWTCNEDFPNGLKDVEALLGKIRAAGIEPGTHILHTFISPESSVVKGGADRRLQLRETYTLARPLRAGDTEAYVDEDTMNAERSKRCRVLRFGRELMTYEGFTTARPFKFTGLKRGYAETPVADHPEGEIGGTIWVCEYGGMSWYLKQDSDLQDEVAAKVSAFWKAGLRFVYFDGSEGVCAPFAYHVPNAQYRMWKKFDPQPILGEGAAKAHFGWHMLSGANAFDVFSPEEFKEKIIEYPAAEAPLMREDFTRVNFGWWGFWAPGDDIRGKKTMGVQPDMWEFGTSKAAAWDSPASVQMRIPELDRHPRTGDILEVMRRWEDVRAKKWLTPEQKTLLRDPKREFHLYKNEKGGYELVEWHQLAVAGRKDGPVRAFAFERAGKRVVAYWHASGRGTLDLGSAGKLAAENLKYWTTDLPMPEVEKLFAGASF